MGEKMHGREWLRTICLETNDGQLYLSDRIHKFELKSGRAYGWKSHSLKEKFKWKGVGKGLIYLGVDSFQILKPSSSIGGGSWGAACL